VSCYDNYCFFGHTVEPQPHTHTQPHRATHTHIMGMCPMIVHHQFHTPSPTPSPTPPTIAPKSLRLYYSMEHHLPLHPSHCACTTAWSTTYRCTQVIALVLQHGAPPTIAPKSLRLYCSMESLMPSLMPCKDSGRYGVGTHTHSTRTNAGRAHSGKNGKLGQGWHTQWEGLMHWASRTTKHSEIRTGLAYTVGGSRALGMQDSQAQ